jgi:hypothetical protein
MGQIDPNWMSPFAGHASEKSTTHVVMVKAFDWLKTVLAPAYEPPVYNEHHVDGGYTPEP